MRQTSLGLNKTMYGPCAVHTAEKYDVSSASLELETILVYVKLLPASMSGLFSSLFLSTPSAMAPTPFACEKKDC